MSNRAKRRADNKKLSRFQRMTDEQKLAAMCKQGITPKDLQDAYDRGFKAGVDRGIDYGMKDSYAGFLLAAHEVFGFGRKRGRRLLYAADKRISTSLSSNEAVAEVFQKLGVTINFYDPERITETLEGAQ